MEMEIMGISELLQRLRQLPGISIRLEGDAQKWVVCLWSEDSQFRSTANHPDIEVALLQVYLQYLESGYGKS
jgi:hypothetical protein